MTFGKTRVRGRVCYWLTVGQMLLRGWFVAARFKRILRLVMITVEQHSLHALLRTARHYHWVARSLHHRTYCRLGSSAYVLRSTCLPAAARYITPT
jgi:hypothetical protein